jgi:hypothetical protein
METKEILLVGSCLAGAAIVSYLIAKRPPSAGVSIHGNEAHEPDFSPIDHTHPDLAPLNHTHPDLAPLDHTHPDLAPLNHTHPSDLVAWDWKGGNYGRITNENIWNNVASIDITLPYECKVLIGYTTEANAYMNVSSYPYSIEGQFRFVIDSNPLTYPRTEHRFERPTSSSGKNQYATISMNTPLILPQGTHTIIVQAQSNTYTDNAHLGLYNYTLWALAWR